MSNKTNVISHNFDRPTLGSLDTQLDDYNIWREGLLTAIIEYQDFVEREGQSRGIGDLPIYDLIETLKTDKLTVAIVGEFSRGKTELINSIFFADHKARLLPTDAGRTTMCPTEIRYDDDLEPSLMLLPIETRETTTTIAEYKRKLNQWTRVRLDLMDPIGLQDNFNEIVKSKLVSIQEAQALDLYDPLDDTQAVNARNGMVEIPVWRHAIINYPHPLLKKGLVILDTPGLNSLGAEPELTLSMLPAAHAVIFVLSADTGVTKSDLEVWNHYVRPATDDSDGRRIVVLNKIDTLWDELRGEEVVAASISRQAQETAVALEIPKTQVFPVSALKGLIGKIQQNPETVIRSGLLDLELNISKEVIPYKQSLIHDKLVNQLGDLVDNTDVLINDKLTWVSRQYEELQSLRGKTVESITALMRETEREQALFQKRVEQFNISKAKVAEQMQILATHLSLKQFDKLIRRTRKDMHESWNTVGLKVGMKTFFDGAVETMQKVHDQALVVKNTLEEVYSTFQVEYGLTKLKSHKFSTQPYLNELSRLYNEADAFRNSARMVMTEQHFVIKRFFITMVAHARNMFSRCNDDVRAWNKAVMTPILVQIHDHKISIDRRLENLKKSAEQKGSLEERIKELAAVKKDLERQKNTTDYIRSKIDQHVILPH